MLAGKCNVKKKCKPVREPKKLPCQVGKQMAAFQTIKKFPAYHGVKKIQACEEVKKNARL
jgi:hypothetical protein